MKVLFIGGNGQISFDCVHECVKMGYNVTFQRFLIGKIDVIKLNIASNSQETARMAYINRLRNYWTAYYNLRSLTLFDFENNRPLVVDYDKLLEE